MHTRSNRCGLTLTEVVCAIGIVGLLLALLLPAVAASREAARRIECANKQRQLALACHAFHDTHRRLPRQNFTAVPADYLEPPGAVSAWGQLLPYLGDSNLFARIDLNEKGSGSHHEFPTSDVNGDLLARGVPVLVCPSDTAPSAASNMRVCLGSRAGSPYAAGKGAFYSLGGFRRSATFDMIIDGLSQTTLCSERVVGDFDRVRWTPARDVAYVDAEEFSDPDVVLNLCSAVTSAVPSAHFSGAGATWLLNGYRWVWYNHVAPPNAQVADCANGGDAQMSARSLHPGGVNAAFSDGAVRFISDSIDIEAWRAMGTRAGND